MRGRITPDYLTLLEEPSDVPTVADAIVALPRHATLSCRLPFLFRDMLEDLIIESGESLTNTLMRFAIAGMLVRHFDELKLFDVALEQLELAEDEDRLKVRRRPPAVDGLASTLVGTLDRTRRSQSPGTRGGVAVVREPTMLDGDLVPRWREDTVIRINICFTSVP